jgi:uncharacterized membrane-anchored protein YitT (DUF2179 family)
LNDLKKKSLIQWALLLAGTLLTAAPFPMLFIPHEIAPGGLTGVATVINALTGLPVGALTAAMNLPLFLIGWKRMGRLFAVKSLVGMVAVSVWIDYVPFPVIPCDALMAALFGGALMGLGIGLVIRGGATTGGTDMMATMIHDHFPAISVGGFLLAIDCVVIALSALVFDLQAAMVAMVALFISTQVMDRTVEGFNSAKAFFVFSRESAAIADAVLRELNRGATLLHSRGAYSQSERDVLLCVVTRLQIPRFKAIVRQMDAEAFVVVTDVREAMGEGFTLPQSNSEEVT